MLYQTDPQNLSQDFLSQHGFKQYNRLPNVVMCRPVMTKELPLTITSYGQLLYVDSMNYMLACDVDLFGNVFVSHPIRMNEFENTYMPNLSANLTEKHQLCVEQGCSAYTKVAPVWAKFIEEDVFIQGLEHNKPAKIEAGNVLVIGASGEPYAMPYSEFVSRYEV
jgi:hypothetical protein